MAQMTEKQRAKLARYEEERMRAIRAGLDPGQLSEVEHDPNCTGCDDCTYEPPPIAGTLRL